MISNHSPLKRPAVTLIEVLFSIGVILIGLLGLLSVLPLAGRQAQQAVSMTAGAAVGDAIMQELQTRHWLRDEQFVHMNGEALRYFPQGKYPLDLTNPYYPLELTNDVAGGSGTPRTPGTEVKSFCIDPLYVSGVGGTATAVNGYSDILFPYYALQHDPLANPSAATSWPVNQPRMIRLGLRDPNDFTKPYAATSMEAARLSAENPDDLVVTRPDDRSLDGQLLGLETDSGLEYGRKVPAGDFRWLATISPLSGYRFASVSVVILKNRDFSKDFPSTLVEEPRENGVSERVAYVSFARGFRGGAGGVAYLAGSNTTLSKLKSNEWVMLSRRIDATLHVHRWYRIASVSGDPAEVETTAVMATPIVDTELKGVFPTATGTKVWFQKVLLDGPDWNFGLDNNSTTGLSDAERIQDDTFVTIVPDVVSVTERVIRLRDL